MINLAMASTLGIFILSCQTCFASGWSWSKLPSSPAPKVSGHSSGFLHKEDGDDVVFVFGGLTGPAGSPCTDETWQYQHNDGWTEIQVDVKPRVRMYGASSVLQGKFYLFGGWDPGSPGSGGNFLDDVWEFDPEDVTWRLLDMKLPFPVSRHAACPATTKSGEAAIVIHTFKGLWLFQVDKDGKAKLQEQETTGDESPEGLSMCAVASLGATKMLLFGGSTRTQQLSRDAYVLDCERWAWSKLLNTGEAIPPTLASACAAPVADDQVIVFGGATIGSTGYEGGTGLIPKDETWLLTVKDDMALWTLLESMRGNPESRLAASLCPIGPSAFLLQGGYDSSEKITFAEPWLLKAD